MDYAYRVFKSAKSFYNTINPATLSGAIDVVVVEQPDGEFKSTPFHVRFGKYGVFSHSDKFVDVSINGEEVDVKMKLGDSGVAYFVEEIESNDQVPDYMITSPLPESVTGVNHQLPDTGKVLEESARKLEENAKDNKNIAPQSPGDIKNEPSTSHQEEQSLSKVQTRTRNLVYSSSVFSNRKNRSLPDLRSLDEANVTNNTDASPTVGSKTSRTHNRKLSYANPPRSLKQSKSQAFDRRKKELSRSNSDLPSDHSTSKRKKSVRISSKPIDIKIETDSESELDSSVSSSNASSPSPSMLDPHEADRIADGALSDSEVDRHRNTPEPDANDVTDWKWGQLPETRENQAKEKADNEKPKETTSSRWTWKFWGSTTTTSEPRDEGLTLDQLMDPAADPHNIEKYLGKPGSISIDSGNCSRGVSQPASPTGSGHDERFIDQVTPTRENAVPTVTKITPPASPSGEILPPIKETTIITDVTPTSSDDKITPVQETTVTTTVSATTTTGNGLERPKVVRTNQRTLSSSDGIFSLREDDLESVEDGGKTFVRSLRLSSERLKSLGLARGANECRFSITTKFQGTSLCTCNIYLFKWNEQIVISDVDGTITKSDVLGHVIPAIGGTWAHNGVAELYTRIKNNGYKMVYLSSRAIGQSHTTKQYLKSVAQDSKQLPDGPVLLSPTSVLMAFRREVIERRPEEFKIAALSDLKKLFPVKQPFFAGFGNRETDVTSYRAVDILPARILIIDSTGRVRRSDSFGYVSSYLSMASETVDYLFPPLDSASSNEAGSSSGFFWTKPLEHSTFTHWKESDNGEVSVTDEDLIAYEAKRKLDAEKAKKK